MYTKLAEGMVKHFGKYDNSPSSRDMTDTDGLMYD